MNILIVNDDSIFLNEVSDYLSYLKITPFTAQTSVQAIDVLIKTNIQAVFCEGRILQQNASKLLKHIKKNYPQVFVIAIVPGYEVSSALSLIENGVFDYIKKPAELSEFNILLVKIMNNIAEDNIKIKKYHYLLDELEMHIN
ncbi:response regulator [Spirochaetota bacterium]